jgi:2-oxo-4-hydroxy-4-carboxy-5-ureidoimidazoline decarboxylase
VNFVDEIRSLTMRPSKNVKKNLEKLNEAPAETAEARFLDCCGSRRWARRMSEARPFADEDALVERAAEIWRALDAEDWLEAFAAHPKIGARRAAPAQKERSAAWSRGEQAGADAANEAIRDALAEANRLYEERFGFIFIVCATGKSAAEMLGICHERLENTGGEEIRNAAEEQRKITEIRLKKLLETET